VVARGQRRGGARQTARRTPSQQRGGRARADSGLIPILAQAVRAVESAVERGSVMPSVRTKFQVIALLVREERARVKGDDSLPAARREEEMRRLDGIGTILAKTSAMDPSLLALLTEDATLSEAGVLLRDSMLESAGREVPRPEQAAAETADGEDQRPQRAVPQSVLRRQLANPFLAPDFEAAREAATRPTRLSGWELLGPLFRSFERDAGGSATACMTLPDPDPVRLPAGRELMHHQAQVVASAAAGHRTFLLADEPGLGKTAQALLAAQAADAYPLLVVAPNVVKTNWAHEVSLWTPRRRATVVHGDGDSIDGFADIVIVNYEVLDRHVGWMSELGFRGMVVDEAHFIKNKSSQRSQHVLEISDRIRSRVGRPLLMALTGTPLINDIEDFRAIWQFLGWIDDKRPLGRLMSTLDDTGLAPDDPGFYPAARRCVVEMGIVRRRKVDVAADIPARRVADLPVELDGELGRSIRAAERALAERMVKRYHAVLERRGGEPLEGIDRELVRQVATWERAESASAEGGSGSNVFTMMRRIGQAKAGLAADYAAQLARNVGKVVFFAKHVDVMDAAQELFAQRGIRYASIRGDQTRPVRQRNVDAFVNDPDVSIVVCSLTAAGVGINLQVASDMVLAELSWTDAEQTQAIDRIHRIGQDSPVTAWRVLAAQTIDVKIAELIDRKAGLAARALDGAAEEDTGGSADVQVEALVALLTDALAPAS
jgi:hypothetical protein